MKMKKTMLITLIFLVLVCSVFAQGSTNSKVIDDKGNDLAIENPKGLENAQIRVQNLEDAVKLMQNLEKFQNKYQNECSGTCNIELDEDVDGNTLLKQKKQTKLFGLFNINAEENFVLNDEGEIQEQSRNFGQFLLQLRLSKEV